MILYTNSCSYGVCSTGKTYTDFVGEGLSVDQVVVNGGGVGSCNMRIFRTTIRDILELEAAGNNPKEIVALISLASTYRSEVWLDDEPAQGNDGHFHTFQISSSLKSDVFNFSPNTGKRYATEWFRMYNQEAEITNLFFMLTMMVEFFKSKGITYLIWNGPMNYKPIDFNAPFIKPFYDNICEDPGIIDLTNFSFSKFCSIDKNYVPYDFDDYGIYGHHCEEAHQEFANFLLSKLNEISLRH